ncbi:hypothetical protein LTR62_006364 [Meristemomyces frigidus]|uniref:Serine/threonine-protein phosphatase 2A activator n=1 Tax=Meristemomyces frigidus TaxID=1508187 RepID=A0AAN7TCY6_9PEZI|nr:hypothetical protein LTR62_006364 [Meristemomyces frigidus]
MFSTPSKRINDGGNLAFFLSSTAYRDVTLWLLQLNRSMFPTKSEDGRKQEPSNLLSPPLYSANVESVRSILDDLTKLLEKAPPSTGPRRFGNVAFRDWSKLAEEEVEGLLIKHLSSIPENFIEGHVIGPDSLLNELRSYLLGSFGSAQRLDYGTGHELSFLAFLGCLWKLNYFKEGEERAIVMGIIQPYLVLVRRLIGTYTLEPAGSHGVWGLDDHSFLPYIFGSAQYGPAIDSSSSTPTEGSFPSAPSPTAVTKATLVADYKDGNMYFSAIQFIYDVKKGPFWEHSPILYDISGLKDGWGKVNKGMLKMWAAECLGKFPVVQHFLFGSLFRWEADPAALGQGGSVPGTVQPPALSMDVAVPVAGGGETVGTAAPWAKSGGESTAAPWARPGQSGNAASSSMPASTGVPSMRAPWAAASPTTRVQPSITGTPASRAPAPYDMANMRPK